MLKIIGNLLRQIADKIDSGDISSNSEETMKVMETLKLYTDREEKLSKYQACLYLNMSRATFDNYVKSGEIPKGKRLAGFKEVFFIKRDLDLFIKNKKTRNGLADN